MENNGSGIQTLGFKDLVFRIWISVRINNYDAEIS
jgi:hypothetical protein